MESGPEEVKYRKKGVTRYGEAQLVTACVGPCGTLKEVVFFQEHGQTWEAFAWGSNLKGIYYGKCGLESGYCGESCLFRLNER